MAEPRTIAERRRVWIEALRSGTYPQGDGYLYNNGKYCCLGVAREVLGLLADDSLELLDIDAADLLGIGRSTAGEIEPVFKAVPEPPEVRCVQDGLANMNDNGKTFDEIADVIEMLTEFEQLAGLI